MQKGESENAVNAISRRYFNSHIMHIFLTNTSIGDQTQMLEKNSIQNSLIEAITVEYVVLAFCEWIIIVLGSTIVLVSSFLLPIVFVC
jgi:hypothetical protein